MKYPAKFEYLAPKPPVVLLASPIMSISSTLPFFVDSQSEHYKRLAHSLTNMGGIPLKANPRRNPRFSSCPKTEPQSEQVWIFR